MTVKIREIRRAVELYYGISTEDMTGPRRYRSLSKPRQIGMVLAREFTASSLPAIGIQFGRRDHTTVLHAMNAVRKWEGPYADDLAKLRRVVAAFKVEKAASKVQLTAVR